MDLTAAQRVDLERRVAGSLHPATTVLADTLAALVAALPERPPLAASGRAGSAPAAARRS